MALKKKSSGGGGANWMDTYGDMVTLLLCFFVLLYSMSTISEENWKAIVMSFNPSAVIDPDPTIEGNKGPSADEGDIGMPTIEQQQQEVDRDIEDLFQAIQQYIQSSSQQDSISVSQQDGKVYISFGQTVFFDGEKSTLRDEARPVLEAVSEMLGNASNSIGEIRVLGHTAQGNPNRPNRVRVDRELSSMRATNVVIFIQERNVVAPEKLVSEGIGQWRPVDTNLTSEGRSRNRRVEMIISGRDLQLEAEGTASYYTADYTTE